MEWLKNNILAIAASMAGLGAVAGGYHVIVASGSGGQSGIIDRMKDTPIPPRFFVHAAGRRNFSFLCDLTADANAVCRSDRDWRTMENQQIVLERHPGDVTRIKIGVFGTWERGFNWQQLSKGVTVAGYTLQGHEWDPAKERR